MTIRLAHELPPSIFWWACVYHLSWADCQRPQWQPLRMQSNLSSAGSDLAMSGINSMRMYCCSKGCPPPPHFEGDCNSLAPLSLLPLCWNLGAQSAGSGTSLSSLARSGSPGRDPAKAAVTGAVQTWRLDSLVASSQRITPLILPRLEGQIQDKILLCLRSFSRFVFNCRHSRVRNSTHMSRGCQRHEEEGATRD